MKPSKFTGDKPEGEDPPTGAEPVTAPEPTSKNDVLLQGPGKWFQKLTPPGETARERTNRLADFKAASAAHGWVEHRRHEGGKSLEISEADYRAAIKGATSGEGRKGVHAPALSIHRGKGI